MLEFIKLKNFTFTGKVKRMRKQAAEIIVKSVSGEGLVFKTHRNSENSTVGTSN